MLKKILVILLGHSSDIFVVDFFFWRVIICINFQCTRNLMELFISDLVGYRRMGELEELGQFLTKETRIDIKVFFNIDIVFVCIYSVSEEVQ